MDRWILLVGKKIYLVDRRAKTFNTEFGKIDLTKIKKYGQKIRAKRSTFIAIKPTIIDFIRHSKRMPQVILPRDAASIVAETGLSRGWNCLDAGGGSGFLTMFIANIANPGKVYCYEKNEKFYKNILKNVEKTGLKNIVVKNKDVFKFTEKNLDLITLDMVGAEDMVEKCYKRLNPGGWLAVYSPHIEQVKSVRDKMKKFSYIKTIENTVRVWKVDTHTHPVPSGIIHTGFITFGRKIE